jgi:hypothetical protein
LVSNLPLRVPFLTRTGKGVTLADHDSLETERLPIHLGWQRPPELFTLDDLMRWIDTIVNVTAATPDPTAPGECKERRKPRNVKSHFKW